MDLVVIGGGSGGIAAALAGAQSGMSVTLIEAAPVLGGTATRALVCTWEPGIGGTGLPLEAYRRLRQRGGAAIHRVERHCAAPDPDRRHFPGGENRLVADGRYGQTLRRWGAPAGGYPYAFMREHCRGVAFIPEAWEDEAAVWLAELGVTVRTGTAMRAVRRSGTQIRAVDLSDGSTLHGRTFIDATADVVVARAAGCATRCGRDAQADFAEPGAPGVAGPELNGVSLVYRLAPDGDGSDPGPVACWWAPTFPVSHVVELPDGGLVVNPLPIMTGREACERGAENALAEAQRRCAAHWQDLRHRWPEFRTFRLVAPAPALGVREGHRIIAERMLTEHDVRGGIPVQRDPDIIAIADHALDVHGFGSEARELAGPYGIPFRCLVPQGCDNLLIACRGAGFSSIAASSCRLSRTMMQLGQAAGTAAALAARSGVAAAAVDPEALRAELDAQGVQLTAEPTPAVAARIASVG